MSCSHVGRNRNAVPLRIHALDVGVVVLPLRSPTGLLRSIRTGDAADQQPGAGTNCRPLLTTNGGPRYGTDRRADGSRGNGRLPGTLAGRSPPVLLQRITAAEVFIRPEVVKGAAASRQHHHAWPGRRADASSQEQTNQQAGYGFVLHRRFAHRYWRGGTRTQPPGHWFTCG